MKYLIVLFFYLFSTSVFAGYVSTTGKVTLINNWQGHGGHLIQVENMSGTSSICERNDYYILPEDHQFFKENYSLLLSARVSGMNITLRVSNSADNKCVENFPRIFHIQI